MRLAKLVPAGPRGDVPARLRARRRRLAPSARPERRDHGPAGDHGRSLGRPHARTTAIKNQYKITEPHAGGRRPSRRPAAPPLPPARRAAAPASPPGRAPGTPAPGTPAPGTPAPRRGRASKDPP